MTKVTHSTNLTIVVKIIDLDISRIYNYNHMVGMDKIFSSDCDYKFLMKSPTFKSSSIFVLHHSPA